MSPQDPAPLAARLRTLVASAALLMFFSELVFGNEPSIQALAAGFQGDPWAGVGFLLEMTFWYLFMTWPLHAAMTYGAVHELGGLFLAGCLYGWAAEGVVVPVVYEAVPLSFLWTSVAWHAPIDAILGWYLCRRVLREGSGRQVVVLACLWGGTWGIWSGTYFRAAEMPDWGLAGLLPITLASAAVGVPAALVVARASAASFRPGRPELVVLVPLTGLLALAQGYAALPWSLGLLGMVGLTVWAIRARRDPARRPLLRDDGASVSWSRGFVLMLAPLVATGLYAPVRGAPLPLFLLTAPLLLGSAVAWTVAVLLPSWPWAAPEVTASRADLAEASGDARERQGEALLP